MVRIPFEDRWRRFDETVQALRALLGGDPAGFEGEFYSTGPITLEPRSPQQPGPPMWVASWGSSPGLRRVARYGDGWLASAYNTTPDRFRESLVRLADALRLEGREADRRANAIATTWLCITDTPSTEERVYSDVLAPMLNRSVEELRSLSLPIGPAEVCAERLAAFANAGAERVFLWPIRDELTQLELFMERVAPLL